MTRTVFVPTSGSPGDFEPVVKMFEDEYYEVVTTLEDAKELHKFDRLRLVCFTGGSDVSPYLYGEENVSSYCDPLRDEYEKELYETFLSRFVPMVGICRGGQLLNVLNGGSMIQHIEGHSMGHREIFVDSEWLISGKLHGISRIKIHEDHHQGMIKGSDCEIIGYDQRDGNSEILWCPGTDCLCFQPHPEWGHQPTKELFFELLEEYLF